VINLSVSFFSPPITVSGFILPALVFHHPELAREVQIVEASAVERDVPNNVTGDEIKRVGPDLEALKVLISLGEDDKCGCHLVEAPHAEAESGDGRLVATRPQTPQASAPRGERGHHLQVASVSVEVEQAPQAWR
jgi:hypothetical protein